jgi:transposase
MKGPLVGDELWGIVEPLLPPEPPRTKGGRPPCVLNRSALEGIIYVLKSGIPWRMLPKEFGCSGVTCWRRLRGWLKAGVWRRLRRVLLDKFGRLGLIDWSRASLDSVSVPAKKGREDRPQTVDRGRPGSKRHLLVDGSGVPLAVVLTGA